MLEFTAAFRKSPGRSAQLILARDDLLPQVELSASRIFVRRTWKKKFRSSVHDLIREPNAKYHNSVTAL